MIGWHRPHIFQTACFGCKVSDGLFIVFQLGQFLFELFDAFAGFVQAVDVDGIARPLFVRRHRENAGDVLPAFGNAVGNGRAAADGGFVGDFNMAAMTVWEPILQLWPIWTWLSILVPLPTVVSLMAPRSMLLFEPISTSSPSVTAPVCGILNHESPAKARPKPSAPMTAPLWISTRLPSVQP